MRTLELLRNYLRRGLRCGWRSAALQLGLALVLVLLVVAPAGTVNSPLAQVHASQRTGYEMALENRREGKHEVFRGLPSLRVRPTPRLTVQTTAVRFSTGSGGTCHSSDTHVTVQPGDTLGGIATRYGTTWVVLASYNHISKPDLILPQQVLCIPTSSSPSAQGTVVTQMNATTPQVGQANLFPYGQCTWWANQRYFQLHGVYVPWTINADAWEWTARAHDFGWQVSTSPQVGDIIDLQPWVQGAYGLGHVAVVERILANGHVIASNMNWGATLGKVVDVEFSPGAGVTFIRL